jgi:hypothetical protein
MSNNVSIGQEAMHNWQAGSGTVGETPTQLFPAAFIVRKSVIVRANAGNSGTITLGNSAGSAGDGFILAAGDTSPEIKINDLSKVWLVGSASDQAFSWLAI